MPEGHCVSQKTCRPATARSSGQGTGVPAEHDMTRTKRAANTAGTRPGRGTIRSSTNRSQRAMARYRNPTAERPNPQGAARQLQNSRTQGGRALALLQHRELLLAPVLLHWPTGPFIVPCAWWYMHQVEVDCTLWLPRIRLSLHVECQHQPSKVGSAQRHSVPTRIADPDPYTHYWVAVATKTQALVGHV